MVKAKKKKKKKSDYESLMFTKANCSVFRAEENYFTLKMEL
jgi:hypothetical protein